jgi:group I intron endonuclease
MAISGIYQIRNLINNKIYVGSSINLKNRKNTHFHKLRKNSHSNLHLQNAWNKYGENNFIFEILEECKEDFLLAEEQKYIEKIKPEYNIRKIAESNFGLKHSKESIEKMSGEKNINAKINQEVANEIRKLYNSCKISQLKLAKMYNLHLGTIQQIIENKTWKDSRYDYKKYEKDFSGENNPSAKLKLEQVTEIRRLYETKKYSYRKLVSMFQISKTNIADIIKNKIWKNLSKEEKSDIND